MIELVEAPYDGDDAKVLIGELLVDIDQRYAFLLEGLTPDEIADGDAAYLAEVRTEEVTRPRGVFLVARFDGALVGCGAVRAVDHPDGAAVGEIKRMYTRPAARRRGVSRALLERLESVGLELGFGRLVLETGTAQPEAVALYESGGWARIAPYGRFQAEWTICLAKDLVGP